MKKYYLMAPGPTPVPSNVLMAMAQPMIHHRTPEYEALFIEVRAGLKRLFQTSQDVVPFTSSGTGAMEAAVVNTLSAGDTVLALRAGKFGERWEEICRAHGVTVIPLERSEERRVGKECRSRWSPRYRASASPICGWTSGAWTWWCRAPRRG